MTTALFASALLAIPFVGVGTASAAPQETELMLAVYQDGNVRTARLSCAPAEGEHNRPDRACAQIAAAEGEFSQLAGKPGEQICILIYDPVTVAAFGTFQGEPVRYIEEFPNSCVLASETGAVFDI